MSEFIIPKRYLSRGKRLDDGNMVHGYYLPRKWSFRAEENCENVIIVPQGASGLADLTIEIDPLTIGKCTGKPDENGALIYESDILKITIMDSRTGKEIVSGVAPVIWNDESFCFGVIWGNRQEFARFDNFTSTTFEIIGNLFDNPELLETDTTSA